MTHSRNKSLSQQLLLCPGAARAAVATLGQLVPRLCEWQGYGGEFCGAGLTDVGVIMVMEGNNGLALCRKLIQNTVFHMYIQN